MIELNEQIASDFLRTVYAQGIPENTRLVLTNTPQFNNGLWFTNVDDALAAAINYKERSLGCCIALRKATAEQPGERGTAKECAFLPAFFVDVDYAAAGHRTKGHLSREVLEVVMAELPAKPSLTVHTGGGFHLYWLLDMYLDLDLYRPDAEKVFKALAKWFETRKAKPEQTNIAGCLRLPGSVNRKRETPDLLTVEDSGMRYTLEQLAAAFDTTPRSKCAYIHEAADRAKDVSYDTWFKLAIISAHVEGGEEMFHNISQRDPDRYDQEEAAKKLNEGKTLYPPRCENLTMVDGGKCPMWNGTSCRLAPGVKTPVALLNGKKYSLVDKMNERFAILNGNGSILHEWIDPKTGRQMFELLNRQQFGLVAADLPYVGEDKEPAVNYWLRNTRRRVFYGFEFEPNSGTPGYYNLWRGFAVQPDATAICELYLAHLRDNVCQGNAEHYEYLLNWMADAVQNPGSKPGVAIVLQSSVKGTGKNTAISYFGSLFGEHYVELAQSKHLFGHFNAHLRNAIIVFADEAFWAGAKSDEGVLKAMITSPVHIIEQKRQDAFQVPNYIHLMIATNNEWAVPAGEDERRFFVLEVGTARAKDTAYFGAIANEMEHGGREALLHFLMNRDLTNVDIRKYPETSGNAKQKLHTNPLLAFLVEKLGEGKWYHDAENWTLVPKPKLLGEYRRWLHASNYPKFTGGQDRFTEVLGKLMPSGFPKPVRPWVGESRLGWHLEMPAWQELKAHLDAVLGVPLDVEEPCLDMSWAQLDTTLEEVMRLK
jgi:hypothetical protein